MKKIMITAKPTMPTGHASVDAWVNDRHRPMEPTKRFTIDVPKSLHKRVKSQCALRSIKMTDMLRELLEKHFPEEYEQERAGEQSAV